MTETWPAYEVKVLDQARILNSDGETVWEPPDHVTVVRVKTKVEGIIPVPKKLVGDHNKLRRYVIDEFHRRIDADPRSTVPNTEPTPEPDEEPTDQHDGPLDNEDDARYLDPVDPRRREAEQRRGRPFADDEETTP
jgi:hypothetical protein